MHCRRKRLQRLYLQEHGEGIFESFNARDVSWVKFFQKLVLGFLEFRVIFLFENCCASAFDGVGSRRLVHRQLKGVARPTQVGFHRAELHVQDFCDLTAGEPGQMGEREACNVALREFAQQENGERRHTLELNVFDVHVIFPSLDLHSADIWGDYVKNDVPVQL